MQVSPVCQLSNALFGNSTVPVLLPTFRFIIFPAIKQGVVLDVGCGKGYYLDQLSRKSVGLDDNATELDICRLKGLNVIFFDLNTHPYQLSFEANKFDAVFASHVLEHVKNPSLVLKELLPTLKPNGTVYIGLPSYNSVLRLFGDDYFKHHEGHVHIFTPDATRALLQDLGYQVFEVFWDPFFLRYQHTKLYRHLFNLFQKLPGAIKNYFSIGFWCVAKKIS